VLLTDLNQAGRRVPTRLGNGKACARGGVCLLSLFFPLEGTPGKLCLMKRDGALFDGTGWMCCSQSESGDIERERVCVCVCVCGGGREGERMGVGESERVREYRLRLRR
jgi:hypothetical protein